MKGKVLITDPVHDLLQDGLVQMGYDVDYRPEIQQERVHDIIADYVGLIINSKIKAGMQLFERAEHLKFIGRLGSGLEVIDQAAAKEKGIHFFNSPEGNRDAVAEHAMGMLLSLMNNIHIADREVRDALWMREVNRGVELKGKTVGIIGYGNTGSEFAQRLQGFGVKILAYDKYKSNYGNKYVLESTLDAVLFESDVLSLHIQLTDESHHLINRQLINKLGKAIYLVNTSRGGVVNTADLIYGIKAGKILGAALDVLENEHLAVLQGEELAVFEELVKERRVLLTPHIAGWTHESKKRIAEVVLDKVRQFEMQSEQGFGT
ncbi:MAG: NAD(P)-dependent oxidoreductase [Chitinophagales bacterium]|nr:NAD(P)-dependent oxidoreductase [Chitinophagales bacterium]